MAYHKSIMKDSFALPSCEKNFHDHDEILLFLKGSGTSYWIDI